MQNDLAPDTRLTRTENARALTEAGFPITPGSLAVMACRLQGPPYELWGRFAIYTWGTSLAWAKARSRPGAVSAPGAVEADRKERIAA